MNDVGWKRRLASVLLACGLAACGTDGNHGNGDSGNENDENEEPAKTWSPASPFVPDPEGALLLAHKLNVAPNGDATVLWTESGDRIHPGDPVLYFYIRIWAKHYHASSRMWSEPVLVRDTEDSIFGPYMLVGSDSSGNVLAVWVENTSHADRPARDAVWACRYSADSGWGVPLRISASGIYPFSPDLSIDPGGHAVAVWGQGEHFGPELFSNRYTPGIGWSRPTRIAARPGPDRSQSPASVAVDGLGNALGMWTVWTAPGLGSNQVLASRSPSTGGWSKASGVYTPPGSLQSGRPRVAFDGSGNAFAVWTQENGNALDADIYSSRYSPGTGWSAAAPIEPEPPAAFPSEGSRLTVNARGDAIVAWAADGGPGR
jgi:hypothetical protein